MSCLLTHLLVCVVAHEARDLESSRDAQHVVYWWLLVVGGVDASALVELCHFRNERALFVAPLAHRSLLLLLLRTITKHNSRASKQALITAAGSESENRYRDYMHSRAKNACG